MPEAPQIPPELPVLTLRGTVVFPRTVAPIALGQKRSLRLAEEAMRGSRLVGLAALRGGTGAAGGEQLHEIGTAAMIHQLMTTPDGRFRLVVQGLERVRFGELVQTDPFLVARVAAAPDEAGEDDEVGRLAGAVRERYQRLVLGMPSLPDELFTAAAALRDPVSLAYLVAATAPLGASERHSILEVEPARRKLERILDLLETSLAAQRATRPRAPRAARGEKGERAGRDASPRDAALKERVRTIQRELSEGDPEKGELRELRERLSALPLASEPRREVQRELARLERLPAISPEHAIVRNYLDWILALPWGRTTGARIDVAHAQRVLDEDHYDVVKVKDRILEYLAVKKLREERHARISLSGEGEAAMASVAGPLPATPADEARREPILCFVGPPGVGKTSLGHSIARALGREFVRISLGGVHDEAEIRGHRRTYMGSMPGRIIQGLRRAGTVDPVFMLDEMDKLGMGFHGDPSAALLEVLDPAQNRGFVDAYLGLPFDLSHVMFICTANTTETIPSALIDRMELLYLSGYTEAEKLRIARRHLLPKLVEAHGLRADEVEIEDDAIGRVVHEYTREAGVRGLERQLATALRKVARRISEGGAGPIKVTEASVPELLGRPRYLNDTVEQVDRPGVAMGLAWTPFGGDVLFIEAMAMAGDERLILTGQLGEVMRESAQAALSFLRAQGEQLGLDTGLFRRMSIHLHIPHGAIPKDGPSAGVTMLAAMASLAAGRRLRPALAMTGEITLRGRVLPVGGIKEKVLAAYRAGVKTIVMPRQNEGDLEDIPEEVRRALDIVSVDTMEQVVTAALEPPRSKQRREVAPPELEEGPAESVADAGVPTPGSLH